MHLLRTASRAVTTSLLSLPLHVNAQSGSYNQNLTLRFFQNSPDSCDYSATTRALTFTTSSIPLLSHCFDVDALFGGNATQGFVNQTRNIAPPSTGEAGIYWQLENLDTYDSQANYSSVLYRQHITSPINDDQKPGKFAQRGVTLYAGKGCSDLDPSADRILDWYGFNCWSEDKGDCGTTPWNIGSFNMHAPGDDAEGTCWVFAKNGNGARRFSSSQAMMGAVIAASLAIWLA
ncbi:hypothetical protein P3342_009994 [Pyrenophora teres f. teres]|uniref:Uncharacterized protein n=2 Tax=Pyrenophora teres f. teres TaxID=97479 RepID=E3RDB2_PYRTT|nr:hypothetical protein PTT_01938 [Pyrenophora teres f. teres 0-1]KAE8825342.1 hypothetical protein HRS9139_08452 [Pyrenophora teres f. teres]KAE8834438.1 hypothetical protein PTNB85_05771 [Pyrenophora teres f. teres]KAE8844081.1 hypothetical protein HRS9122_05184 [Pyrenophora teres f. teres]KAE8858862.1 hypothetical protein PTNB73_08342 [Pyrenophora teres f. teres]